MSVIVADRTESKFEAIVFSIALHDMLIELIQRNFGIKDFCKAVRNCSSGKETSTCLYLISLYEDLFHKKITVVNKKLCVS